VRSIAEIDQAINDNRRKGDLATRHLIECSLFKERGEAQLDRDQDDERFAWLEQMAKQSRTGISFDWIPPVEGEPSGWRFMRHHFIGDARQSLREAIDAAMQAGHGDDRLK
jgi:hypothetical protein